MSLPKLLLDYPCIVSNQVPQFLHQKHQKYYLDLDLSLDELKFYKSISDESHEAANQLDRGREKDFNAYLKSFLDSYQL